MVRLHYDAQLAGYGFSIHQSSAHAPHTGFDPGHPDWRQEEHRSMRPFVAVRTTLEGTQIESQSQSISRERIVAIAAGLVRAPAAPPA